MNTGQMLITIGAIFLLSLVILRTTTNLLITDNVLNRSKVNLLAVSLATSTIEEANSKAFDKNTVGASVTTTGGLTTRPNLGTESGEEYPLFNDFDDFNSFRTNPRVDSIDIAPGDTLVFQTFCSVDYVADSTPETPSGTATWNKKLTVKVTSTAMKDEETGIQDTIKMSTIFSYWYYR